MKQKDSYAFLKDVSSYLFRLNSKGSVITFFLTISTLELQFSFSILLLHSFYTLSTLLFTPTQVSSKMNEEGRNNCSKLTQEREKGKQRNIHAEGFYVSHYLCQIRFHTGKERQPNITSTDGRQTNCFSFFVQSSFSLSSVSRGKGYKLFSAFFRFQMLEREMHERV